MLSFSVDLASFNLADGDQLLDIVNDHEEVFALLCIGDVVIIRHSAIVFHNDGGMRSF